MATIDRDKLSEYLSAYLDDELPETERQALERLIAGDDQTRRQLEELRQTAELVSGLPRKAAPPSLVEDLTAAAERQQLLGEPEEALVPHRPWWYSARSVMSAAAALVITVGGGWWVFQAMDQPVGPGLVDSGSEAVEQAPARSRGPALATDAARASAEAKDEADTDERLAAKKAATRRISPPRPREAVKAPAKADVMRAAREKGHLGVADTSAGESRVAVASEAQEQRYHMVTSMLTLGQKLAAELPASEIVNHSFDNEVNKLVVLASDRDDEHLARSQITTFAQAKELRVLVLGEDLDVTVGGNERLFFEGSAPLNYVASDQSQFLVRIPRQELGEVVKAVERNQAGMRPLRLTLGPVVANNSVETDALLKQLQASSGPPQAHTFDEPAVAVAKTERAGTAAGAPQPGPTMMPSRATRLPPSAALYARGEPLADTEEGGQPQSADPYATRERALEPAGQPTSAPSDAGRRAGHELIDTFDALLDRLVGGEMADAERGEGAAEPQPEPFEPGRIVERMRGRLPQVGRRGEPDPPGRAGASGARSEEQPPDAYLTLVVQVLRAKPDDTPATQPAWLRD